jgi:hypothetical protein
VQVGSAVHFAPDELLSSLPVQGEPFQGQGSGRQSTKNIIPSLGEKDLGCVPAHLPATPPAAKDTMNPGIVSSNYFNIITIPGVATFLDSLILKIVR